MRRWLAIVLLALLPYQFTWAAVASYCGHEPDTQSQHFGHHDHRHSGAADAGQGADRAATDDPAAFEFDCGHCHGACAGLPLPASGLTVPGTASLRVAPVPARVPTTDPTPPERPQWACLA